MTDPHSPFGIEYDYARGWFMVATSNDLVAGTPLPLYYFGRKLVAFRGTEGQAIVLDATCPHMGANLAVGGRIEGDAIRCPFHEWRFNDEGICDDIPYAERIPPQACVGAYPVDEKNGLIFVWHDPEKTAPDYEIPDWVEYSNPDWVPWQPKQFLLNTQPQEIVDNIADKAHFSYVHGVAPAKFGNRFEGHKAIQMMVGAPREDFDPFLERPKDLNRPTNISNFSYATYHGPAYLLAEMTYLDEVKMVICHTPIDQEKLHAWIGVMIKTDDPEIRNNLDAEMERRLYGVMQDVHIWEHKDPVPRPMICDGDGPIMQQRYWYSQFFKPRDKYKPADETDFGDPVEYLIK